MFDGDELVGDMPVEALVDDVPLYDLEPEAPSERDLPRPARAARGRRRQPADALLALLASPNIASKRFVFEQYDPIVGSRTIRRPQSADAAVLVLEPDGGSGALAISIDGNGRRVACDPYTGAAEAVLECARNLACVGAEPLGLTNCLNFGNPEKPHIAWQLTRAVEGLRDACLALGVPVVGGNVSLYNEGGDGPIYPSPIVGMVGKLPEPAAVPRVGFAEEGHAIALVGMFEPALEGSELEKLRGRLGESLPPLDLPAHADALVRVRAAVRGGELPTAHDVSEGGLACALAECCIEGGIGARVRLDEGEAALFGEGPGGVVVAGPRAAVEQLDGAIVIGEVGGDALEIEGALSVPVSELRAAYEGAIPSGVRRLRAAACTLDAVLVTPMNRDLDHRDGPRDECGVFGVFAPERDVARLAYFALFALQHRGQESAGIATAHSGQIMTVRDMGLVSQVFDEQKLQALQGEMAIGHVRYSTTGSNAWENAQPVWRSDRRQVALAHNGNLINAVELHSELVEKGVQLRGTSDSEIIAALLSTHEAERIEDAVADVVPRLEGAFSTVVMTKEAVVAFRDPAGLRPLALGMLGDDYCVASESCAFDILGAELLRDVQPGEMVSLGTGGIETRQLVESERQRLLRLRAHLLRAPGLDPRGQPHPGLAPQDGRDPLARGAGRGRRGDLGAGLGEPGGVGLLEGVGDPA